MITDQVNKQERQGGLLTQATDIGEMTMEEKPYVHEDRARIGATEYSSEDHAGSVRAIVADVAMTFLLSGDPRLAARATRVLIEDRTPRSSEHSARRRRVWKRRQPSGAR
jgi:hypothetical protein